MAGLGDLLGTVGVASRYPKTVPGESMLGVLEGAVRDVLPVGPLTDKYFGLKADPQYLDKMMNIGLAGMTVWHGSPHKFDRFDMGKVGTGEGAQSYGHGLYLAENPGVAKEYQKILSPRIEWQISPEKIVPEMRDFGFAPKALERAKQTLTEFKGDGIQAVGALDAVASQRGDAVAKEAASVIRSFHRNVKPGGNLYRVDLPDEHIAKMLDWDAPLSQQPEILKTVFDNKLQHSLYRNNSSKNAADFTGAELVRALGGNEAASNTLKQAGIPGIKYLDQGSRTKITPEQVRAVRDEWRALERKGETDLAQGAFNEYRTLLKQMQEGGKPTRNFVVFDDQLPKIIGRE